MAYIRAAQSGNFSATSTWVGGVVPTAGDYACTLAYRITLDVDTDAHLCVDRTDWVAAGGTDSATITGGFDLPADATRVVGGDIRYDNGTTTVRNTSTTSPVYMTSGTLTVHNIVWVSGTNAVVSGAPTFFVVNIVTVAGKISKFTYTGTATILYNTSGSLGTGGVYTVYVSGSGFADLTLGEAVQVQATAGASANCSMLLYLANAAGGYTLTLNGNIPTGASLTNAGVVHVGASSTGIDNQKLIINASTLGYCPVVSVTAYPSIFIASTTNLVSSVRVTASKLSLYGYGQQVISSSGSSAAFGFTANDIETFYGGGISFNNGGSVVIGNIYVNALSTTYSNAAILFTGSGDVTLGNITLRAITSILVTARAVKAISLTGEGTITVGNVSSEAGQLSEIGLLSISRGAAITKSVSVGNIDASNVYVRATSNNNHPLALHTQLVYIARQTTGTITVGSVTGANNGLNVASDTFALTMGGFAADNGAITINGNVVAGNRMSGVLITSSAKPVNINGYIQGVSAILGTTINIPVGVVTYGYVTCNAIKQAVKNCTAIFGQFYFISYTNSVITLVDGSGTVYDLFTVAQQNQVIPATSDVRRGVAVGSSIGTLYVPNAGHVLKDIPVDGTVGSLDLFNNVTALMHQLQGGDTQFRQLDPLWDSVRVHTSVNQDGKLFSAGYDGGFFHRGATNIDSVNTLFGRPTLKLGDSSQNCLETVQNGSVAKPFTTGGENFCLEVWVRPTALPATLGMLFTDTANINVEFTPTGYVGVWLGLNGSYDLSSTPLSINVWTHVAAVRNGSTLKVYFNGISVLTRAITVSTLVGTSYWMFGMPSWSSTYLFTGNVADITMTVGAPRYAAAFTPSTLPYPFNTLVTSQATAPVSALLYNIAAKTDKLGFDVSNNVLAAATVDLTGLTPRFNTIDASLTTANTGITAANNAVAGVKAKTDQLTFGAGGVIAQTGSTDYTARFDTLEVQVSSIPTLTYTTSFAGINTKLDTLQSTVSSGGVDLSPVTNALSTLDTKVTSVKAKTDQLTFTTGGVVADVEVSVQAAIDYTEQFTEITNKLDNVQLVTDTFQFNVDGVIASATVDVSGMVGRFDALDSAIAELPVQTHTDTQYNTLFNQLSVIGNATGAIDLTPVMTSLSQIYTSVENVPRLTYSASFVTVNNKLDALAAATVDVDLTPVLDAIAGIPAPNLTPITTKIDNMQVDVTTIKDAAVRIEVLSSGIRDTLSTATGVDLSGVEHQLSLLNSKFEGIDAPVQVVPTGNAGTTVLYAHCTHPDGTPVAGQSATLHIMQVVGEGTLLPDHTLTSTSDADGLISFVLPRDAGISAVFEYRGRKERVVLVGDATQPLPSIVAKL